MAESHTPNSRRSSTSTILYSQEPYETFSPKVKQLLHGLYPNCDNIIVERMRGGGFNRIVGATLSSREHIIIRISRFKESIYGTLAVLRYLEHRNTIPVPPTLSYDLTDNNPLQSQYIIQKYVIGETLQELMPTLTLEMRLEIVTEIANVIADMCTTTFEHVGVPSAVSDDNVGSLRFATPDNPASPGPFSNTLDFLVACYEVHRCTAYGIDPNDTWLFGYMDKLKEIARAVNMKRPFSNKFCLLHNDFMPRNVHVKTNPNGKLGIAAIFDWDGATSAPIEAAYVVPHWLWTWTPEEEEGRVEIADVVPDSSDFRVAKEKFEEEIELRVPGFTASWREGSTARELFYFAINGLKYQYHSERIDQLARLELPHA